MKSFKTLALVAGIALTLPVMVHAQGGIDADMMRQITQAAAGKKNAALSNAMASNSIDDLAKNYRNSTINDTHVSIETPKQSIHNQRSSGRCWMYSSFKGGVFSRLSLLLGPVRKGQSHATGCDRLCQQAYR